MHIIPMEYSGLSVGIQMMATIMDGLTGNILPFIPAPSKMSPLPAVLQLQLRVFPRKGQVAGNGVYGYASSYACYSDGAQATQHKVENTWHITAKNTCSSHGVTWYECWDTDDGDYYGWIDSNYLSFYDTTPAPAQTQGSKTDRNCRKDRSGNRAAKRNCCRRKTILVTEPPTETMIVENTVLVTETKEPTTTKVVAAVNLDDQSKDDSSKENDSSWLGLLLIGAGILVLAGLAGALIVSYAKRSKEKAAGSVQFHSPWEDQDSR